MPRYVLALWLGLVLFGLYFLTYSGSFESSDGVSIYSVTESIAKRGAFDTSPFIWDRWTAGYQDAQGDFGVDGNLYSKKGLGASIFAAPLTWLALRIPGLGLVQTTYLFNILVTVTTAVVLFLYTLRLGYRRDVALLTGGLFGAATLAWPYARFFYSEPLMGLFLLLAAYLLLAFHQEGRLLYLFGGGLAVGWAAVTRLTNLPLVPIYVLYAIGPGVWAALRPRSQTGQAKSWRGAVRDLLVFSFGVGVCLVVIGLYNYVRFQTPFRSGYAETVGFWTPLWEGLYGLFLSPSKSLFLHAPILILAPLSAPLFLKRHWKEGALVLALIAVPTVTFAKWMDWEGGLAWGPRYLVSVVPLFMVLVAGGIGWLVDLTPGLLRDPTGRGETDLFPDPSVAGRGVGWRVALGVLALWSVAVQVVPASVHFGHYLRVVRALAADWKGFPWAVSPPLVPFVFSPKVIGADLIQLAWYHRAVDGTAVIDWGPLLATALFTVGACGALLWVRTRALTRRAAVLLGVGGVVLALLVVGFGLRQYYNGPDRGAGDDYMALVSHLERHATSQDVLLVSSHVYMGFFMNYNRAPVQWYSLLSKQPDPSPDEVALLEQVVRRHRRVWLAIDRVPSLGLPRPAEKWLTQHAYKLDEQVFSDYCRLCLYTTEDLPDPQVPQHATHLDLGHGLGLVGYDMNTSYPLTGMPRRSELRFSLLWGATAIPDGDFKVFVQLLNAQGQLVWQTDRQPADGFRPTREWRAGERIRDSYGLRLPGDLPAGHYRLIAGMYDPLTLKRLPMTDSAGADTGDYLQLAEMTYLP